MYFNNHTRYFKKDVFNTSYVFVCINYNTNFCFLREHKNGDSVYKITHYP